MINDSLVKRFLRYLKTSPTPFHAVENTIKRLQQAGFQELAEQEDFQDITNGDYYVVRGGSSLIAFRLVEENKPAGFRLIGAHTDSPSLKIKPKPDIRLQDHLCLGVEVYGSPILSSWFDRDLSIAGRVFVQTEDGKTQGLMIDLKNPVASIPHLAIHLTDDPLNPKKIDRHKEIPPVFMQLAKNKYTASFEGFLEEHLGKDHSSLKIKKIFDYDLFLYDTQDPEIIGINQEWIASARIDNLLSCFCGMEALVSAKPIHNTMLVLFDHEEIGSTSAIGAGGTFLKSVFSRLCGDNESFERSKAISRAVSADNAHAVHPNYPEKHDGLHLPVMNRGTVVKTNASQRYANDAEIASWIRGLCEEKNIPLQSFANRSDLRCGSTIGPISSSVLGVQTLDIGAATWAMHSIRERMGTQDVKHYFNCMKAVFESS